MKANHVFALFILLSFSVAALSVRDTVTLSLTDDEYNCVYTVYVRTSKTFHAATDANISLALYDSTGHGILIRNLVKWGGLMGPDHDYFEKGNLDIFSGRGPCLDQPVCAMKLTSDGSGHHPGWYCNYVEVTSTGPHIKCAQQLFTVEQWLDLERSPYELTAIRDNCNNNNGTLDHNHNLGNLETLYEVMEAAS